MWKFWSRLAWRLPNELVYWVLIRAGGYAISGEYLGQRLSNLTFKETLNRWNNKCKKKEVKND
ncbi:hypothetical protein LCGC14_2609190 [marine sediment metagenome]|uniref:Uncharacterized protein n=1 Tax=marine sediment metagenome TaxID=412755 RepID=A0A0F9A6M1_9ZZZZ